MRFLSRRLVMPNDLNFAGSLFGGRILEWIDEEAYIFAACQLDAKSLVTKHIGAISFETSAYQGDVVEFGLGVKHVGRSSLALTCVVRNKQTKQNICVADDIVFVHIDPETRLPQPHGKTKAELESIKIETPE
ncbi:acyl-CoA thioesterase [Pseudidiomarina terrestris]|uniref:Acyl-CoA thioesterase n=1 Tax=Pseudidiomarina terrestris TaxID=2820060 RepID=A0AAW7QWT4_9GAMM|nr:MULTISPECIES: hotdog domain-containing protein [unclassified Pseudidiomarina]MDN7124685.1 acyl-CoA thioesterase [Pseudidiomarina sp. 1APP75-32.1]MDN7126767.1 acyl-CoA thioesterase [Pseudidiomarina sp. 1APR75-33.1]MDN7129024.1 acyl-CoA thioesterase [Pseudidiomarina sp. 1APR75-15]MDN7134713.1 acyl-CoA thioesterase [Pseudidiomarina sp. 1ASP75-5]MDN7136618.1 acyl-CoA thioesterase [Pseudidiomarina sp. 1ASP75-14]